MKKTTRSTGSADKKTGSTSAARGRRSKAAGKPVTIELQAEKTEAKAATAGNSAPAPSARKSSVPKSKPAPKPIQAAATRAKETSTSTERRESAKHESPGFGRTNQSTTANPAARSDTPKPAPASKQPTAQSKTSSGLMGNLAAGVVGGVITLGGVALLQQTGIWSSQNNGNFASRETLDLTRNDLLGKIAGLEERLEQNANNASPQVTMGTVNANIDKKITALRDSLPKPEPVDVSTLENQISASITKLETLQSQLIITDKTVEALKTAVASGNAGEGAGLATLAPKVAELGTQMSQINDDLTALKNAPTSAPVDISQIEAATNAIAALQAEVPTLRSDMEKQFSSLGNQLTDLKSQSGEVGALSTAISSIQLSIQKLSEQTQALEQSSSSEKDQITALRASVDRSQKLERQAAQAIAAAALKNDIDQGEPFAVSLATLQSIAAQDNNFSALSAFADKGVPTASQLNGDFSSVGDAILAALAPPPANDLKSRLLAGAQSLVKIKPIAPQEGDTPQALVAQMANALADEDLQKAADLWQEIPQAGQAVSKDWHDGLQARMLANAAVAKAVQSYLLTTPSQ